MADIDDASTAGDDIQLPDDTWTVAELNEEIAAVLSEQADRFPTYVIGEVADVDQYDFGTFFDLADPDADAVIACLAWSRVVDASDNELTAGTTTLVQANVDFYAERGDCQLLVAGYWPIGEGARTQAVAQLRATLEDEGLLADDRKQALPPYPTCIGVVTSLAGSARDDITTTIHERHPGIRIKLCGATVQGEDAVPSLVGAVQTLETDPTVDVIVVTRGGGADTDLWCFQRGTGRPGHCRDHDAPPGRDRPRGRPGPRRRRRGRTRHDTHGGRGRDDTRTGECQGERRPARAACHRRLHRHSTTTGWMRTSARSTPR